MRKLARGWRRGRGALPRGSGAAAAARRPCRPRQPGTHALCCLSQRVTRLRCRPAEPLHMPLCRRAARRVPSLRGRRARLRLPLWPLLLCATRVVLLHNLHARPGRRLLGRGEDDGQVFQHGPIVVGLPLRPRPREHLCGGQRGPGLIAPPAGVPGGGEGEGWGRGGHVSRGREPGRKPAGGLLLLVVVVVVGGWVGVWGCGGRPGGGKAVTRANICELPHPPTPPPTLPHPNSPPHTAQPASSLAGVQRAVQRVVERRAPLLGDVEQPGAGSAARPHRRRLWSQTLFGSRAAASGAVVAARAGSFASLLLIQAGGAGN